jgi:hypothetical protein
MVNPIRERALRILQHAQEYPESDVVGAIIRLRRHDPQRGDEEYLYPLLDHQDSYIVKEALYALAMVYGHLREMRNLVFQYSYPDQRDQMEMPLQCQAIQLLSELAAQGDEEAYGRLWEIAEDTNQANAPRVTAWEQLAELHAIIWPRCFSEVMTNIHSPLSKKLRRWLRKQILQRGDWQNVLMQVPIHSPHLISFWRGVLWGWESAYQRLWAIAEDTRQERAMRAGVWWYLANLHGIPWKEYYLPVMLDSSADAEAEEVRRQLREAMQQQGGWQGVLRHLEEVKKQIAEDP